MRRGKIIAVRLSDRERELLEDLAKKWGAPLSDVVRWSMRTAFLSESAPNEMQGNHETYEGCK